MKSSLKGFGLRILRLLGALCLIYISMVFYLALTERQIAFPRAILHKEANEAIQGKAKGISCNLEDGIVLGGWQLGNENAPVLLYFPDSDEDAAQFLAEVGQVNEVTFVTFNYRGSGNNKGTPSSETFESDADQIFQCASQVNNQHPTLISGRGVGAILATKQFVKSSSKTPSGTHLILIDPIYSIADRISEKYRLLYPKFLVRATVEMPILSGKNATDNITVIQDKKFNEKSTNGILEHYSITKYMPIDGTPLREKLTRTIQHITYKAN